MQPATLPIGAPGPTLGGMWDALPGLPEIPIVELAASDAAELALHEADRAQALAAVAREIYPLWLLKLGDWRSRNWLLRQNNPYLGEIDRIAAAMRQPGVHMLNLSYEWACTTGACDEGEGMRMLRVLDWPMPGLGRNLAVARHRGPAGEWLNVTWPGFSGVLTGMAKGRFAAAFNQPPLRKRTPFFATDWIADRLAVGRSRNLPPAHLLRHVFDHCRDYEAAKAMLRDTPICLPAFFVLSGTRPGEATVIERLETAAHLHAAPAAVANHWLGMTLPGSPRGAYSQLRRKLMTDWLDRHAAPFDWLTPPILNGDSRVAVETNAATGELRVIGFEPEGQATRPLHIAA
ncbi:MAG: hypothetical protein AB7F08_13600 [Dongiaceae bacterium]